VLFAIVFAVFGTAASAGAQSRFVAGSTVCTVSLTARHGNLDCTFAFDAVDVALPAGSFRATVAADGAAYTYDRLGSLAAVSPAPGGATTYTYDAAGHLVAADVARGLVTQLVYGRLGELVRIEGGGGEVVEFTYDEQRRVIAVQESPGGKTTEYVYDDELGRVSAIATAGEAVVFTYGPEGVVRARAAGETTAYTYDERHTLVGVDGAAGPTAFTNDVRANIRTVTGPDGSATEYSYDRPGRIVARTIAGQVTTYTYDEGGRLLEGDRVTYSYDGDSLESLKDPTHSDVRIAYDASGHVAAIVPADALAAHYEYDELGRLLTVDVPPEDETVIDFYEGLPNEPYVLEIHWDHGDGRFLWVRAGGRMVACSACP